jgi:hypothetical protein
MRIDVVFEDVKCDICNSKVRVEGKNTIPPNWASVTYVLRSGGGHYGLPHSNIRQDICNNCWDTAYTVPEEAFDIHIKHNEIKNT